MRTFSHLGAAGVLGLFTAVTAQIPYESDERVAPGSDSASDRASDRVSDSASDYGDYGFDREPAYGLQHQPDAAPDSSAPPVLAELRLAAGLVDFQVGGRLGGETMWGRNPVAFFLDVEGRPYRRAVRVRESEALEYQFREHRFTFGPGMSIAHPIMNDSLFLLAGAGVGFSFAFYRGSNRGAPVAFPVWLEAGVRLPLHNGWHMAFMYQYFPLPSAPSHRLNLVFGGRKRAGETE